jgi:hypothetical protein
MSNFGLNNGVRDGAGGGRESNYNVLSSSESSRMIFSHFVSWDSADNTRTDDPRIHA